MKCDLVVYPGDEVVELRRLTRRSLFYFDCTQNCEEAHSDQLLAPELHGVVPFDTIGL